ncbi:MAG: hypothetical protein WD037_10715 [Balneolales bacterium]
MFASILVIVGIYLLFKFVDEGIGTFDGAVETLRRVSERRKEAKANPEVDNHWKGIMIGFFFGLIFALLLLGYYYYSI